MVGDAEAAEWAEAAADARKREDPLAERQALEQLVALRPGDADARVRLALLQIDGKRFAAAAEHLERAIELRAGKDPSASMALVYALQAHGRFDEAIAELKRLQRFQDDPRPGARLGWIYLARGDVAAARTEFTAVLDRWPTSRDAQVGLGVVHRREGDLDESRRVLEEAREFASHYSLVHYQLALTYRALGDEVKARQAMAKFEALGGPGAPDWSDVSP